VAGRDNTTVWLPSMTVPLCAVMPFERISLYIAFVTYETYRRIASTQPTAWLVYRIKLVAWDQHASSPACLVRATLAMKMPAWKMRPMGSVERTNVALQSSCHALS
jgi:hypothetical protein